MGYFFDLMLLFWGLRGLCWLVFWRQAKPFDPAAMPLSARSRASKMFSDIAAMIFDSRVEDSQEKLLTPQQFLYDDGEFSGILQFLSLVWGTLAGALAVNIQTRRELRQVFQDFFWYNYMPSIATFALPQHQMILYTCGLVLIWYTLKPKKISVVVAMRDSDEVKR